MSEMVFESAEDLWSYVRSRREYTAVRVAKAKGKKRVYIATPFSEVCRLQELYSWSPGSFVHHYTLRGVGRLALMLRREKVAFQSLYDEYVGQPWIAKALEDVMAEREKLVDDVYAMFETHPVAQWTTAVKGLGKSDALLFLCFIDPHVASTAGKACAFWALAGEQSVRRRKPKSNQTQEEMKPGHYELRGAAYYMAERIWMKRDQYYRPLAEAKKEYYLAKLPQDERGRNAHAHTRALLWLAHLLVSHAWEVWRRFEGLPIHPHRLYMPPKPSEDAVWTDEETLKHLRSGKLPE